MVDLAPVQINEIYTVTIEAVGEKGDGIARIKGFVIFVPNVKEGDNVKIKITKVLKKVGFGEVIEKIEKKEKEPEPVYEDTEDFGSDLDE